jgi:ankyrin repeat protein
MSTPLCAHCGSLALTRERATPSRAFCGRECQVAAYAIGLKLAEADSAGVPVNDNNVIGLASSDGVLFRFSRTQIQQFKAVAGLIDGNVDDYIPVQVDGETLAIISDYVEMWYRVETMAHLKSNDVPIEQLAKLVVACDYLEYYEMLDDLIANILASETHASQAFGIIELEPFYSRIFYACAAYTIEIRLARAVSANPKLQAYARKYMKDASEVLVLDQAEGPLFVKLPKYANAAIAAANADLLAVEMLVRMNPSLVVVQTIEAAVLGGSYAVTQLLLARFPASQNTELYRSLHVASQRGHARIVELLLPRTTGVTTEQMTMCVTDAAEHDNVVRVLLTDARAFAKAQAISLYVESGNLEMVKLMMPRFQSDDPDDPPDENDEEERAWRTTEDYFWQSPEYVDQWLLLNFAIHLGHIEIVKWMLEFGIKPEGPDEDVIPNTYYGIPDQPIELLDTAVRSNQAQIVSLLSRMGYSKHVDDYGSLVRLALENGNMAIFHTLMCCSEFDPSDIPKRLQTPEIRELLLKYNQHRAAKKQRK